MEYRIIQWLIYESVFKKSHIKIKGMYFPRLPKIDTKIRLPINNYFGDIFKDKQTRYYTSDFI